MTILKKLLLVAVATVSGLAQATSMAGFDANLLRPWIEKAQTAVAEVSKRGAFVTPKALYIEQKNVLKGIKAQLKQAAKLAKLNGSATWYTDRQLYKAFKTAVYKNWKKTGLFPAL